MSKRAEDDAQRLLDEVWLTDDDGSPLIPVDPVRIAQALGIDVYTADMQPAFSGAIEKPSDSNPIIYLNVKDSPNRRRFSCAHELGHYYQRTLDGSASYSFTDRRDHMASTGMNSAEVYANRFGASLLMPARLVRRLHRQLDVVELAFRFRVSEEAMRFRLKNLGLT